MNANQDAVTSRLTPAFHKMNVTKSAVETPNVAAFFNKAAAVKGTVQIASFVVAIKIIMTSATKVLSA